MTNNNLLVGISSAVAIAVIAVLFFYNPFNNSVDQNNNQVVNPAPQVKLNIDVICQNALAYMSFPDAESAELYLQECREGKHPEIIENYKAEMGISDDAAI